MVEDNPPVFGGTMLRRLKALSGQAGGDLIPSGRMSGPIFWVIAIMVALTVIAAAAGLSFSNTARSASDELAGGVTIQVIEANPELRARQAEAAAQRLRQLPGVEQAVIVGPDEVERLIEPWLGTRIEGDDAIPVPALVDVRLSGAVNAETLGALRRTVRQVAPTARVDAQSGWLRPVFGAIESLQWLSLVLVGLLAFAMSAAVLLAVRTALGANRDTIEVVHLLGGTDVQIARIFQRSIGFEAIGGGVLGLGLGGLVVLLLGRQFADLGAGLLDSGALRWFDWVLLALIPVAGAVLAMLTARITVLRTLRKML